MKRIIVMGGNRCGKRRGLIEALQAMPGVEVVFVDVPPGIVGKRAERVIIDDPILVRPMAPKHRNDRPYLRKKKGRK